MIGGWRIYIADSVELVRRFLLDVGRNCDHFLLYAAHTGTAISIMKEAISCAEVPE